MRLDMAVRLLLTTLLAVPVLVASAAAEPPRPTASRPAVPQPAPSGLGMGPAATDRPATAPRATIERPTIERVGGVWIEGPGFEVTYGIATEACEARCIANVRCVMIEYYRPERKCNLYDAIRPRKAGGASTVGFKRQPVATAAAPTLVRGPLPAERRGAADAAQGAEPRAAQAADTKLRRPSAAPLR